VVGAPALAYRLSSRSAARAPLATTSGRAAPHGAQTWRYFETFVTEADGWLPPDNFQERAAPSWRAARRRPTSA
jgi:cyclic beta-1,2-glucan synthetase